MFAIQLVLAAALSLAAVWKVDDVRYAAPSDPAPSVAAEVEPAPLPKAQETPGPALLFARGSKPRITLPAETPVVRMIESPPAGASLESPCASGSCGPRRGWFRRRR